MIILNPTLKTVAYKVSINNKSIYHIIFLHFIKIIILIVCNEIKFDLTF